MRSRLAMIGLLALTPIAAILGWWLMPEPRISEANCDRIQVGMTFIEVEEILGTFDTVFGVGTNLDENNYIRCWEGGGNWVVVSFVDGRVQHAEFRRTTLWERLDDWYHGVHRFPVEVVEPNV